MLHFNFANRPGDFRVPLRVLQIWSCGGFATCPVWPYHVSMQNQRGILRLMRTVAAVCLAVCAAKSIYGDEAAPQFHVQFSPEVHAQPYSGRVYLFFSKERDEPRTGPSWFNPELFAAPGPKTPRTSP